MNFNIFTLFPELFPGPLQKSITGAALKNNLWSFKAFNIRNYATDKHKTVDDTPYGGGSGMVLKPDVISNAIERENINKSTIYYLSPRGKPLNQELAINFSKYKEISIICGRYEGVDQRLLDEYNIEEISIGDYIISCGEIAAYVFIDAILRNIDGVLGQKNSLSEESFCLSESKYLLEYPHYTRPKSWKGREVPEILTNGHHKEIEKWRLKKSIEITKENRHDLYDKYINEKNK